MCVIYDAQVYTMHIFIQLFYSIASNV